MTPATAQLLGALIRHVKGALGECEKWLKAQPVRQHSAHDNEAGPLHRPPSGAIDATRQPVDSHPINCVGESIDA